MQKRSVITVKALKAGKIDAPPTVFEANRCCCTNSLHERKQYTGYFGFHSRAGLGIDHFMNTLVHLLNTRTKDSPAKSDRYGVW